MNEVFETKFSRNAAAICLLTAPVFLLLFDFLNRIDAYSFAAYFLAEITVGLLLFSVLAIMQILRPKAEKAGYIGGAIALLGTLKGTTIFAINYLNAELVRSGLDAATMQTYLAAAEGIFEKILWFALPGPLFPLGLLILGIILLIKNSVSRIASIALIFSAILFPVGRFSGIFGFVLTSDILLLISFGYTGWQVLSSAFIANQDLKESPKSEFLKSEMA